MVKTRPYWTELQTVKFENDEEIPGGYYGDEKKIEMVPFEDNISQFFREKELFSAPPA